MSGKSLDDLDVVGLSAILGEDDIFGLDLLVFTLDRFGNLMDPLSEKRIRVGSLNNSFESSLEIYGLNLSHNIKLIILNKENHFSSSSSQSSL